MLFSSIFPLPSCPLSSGLFPLSYYLSHQFISTLSSCRGGLFLFTSQHTHTQRHTHTPKDTHTPHTHTQRHTHHSSHTPKDTHTQGQTQTHSCTHTQRHTHTHTAIQSQLLLRALGLRGQPTHTHTLFLSPDWLSKSRLTAVLTFSEHPSGRRDNGTHVISATRPGPQ